MATTTNYSWTTPDDTALVKDGAAAIRSLGTAIDTTVFNNASAAIAKSIVDAKGDIIAATAADTVARLAVGTNGQVLKANSATATGLEWGSAAASKTFTLLNSGGTALTGAATITVSSIGGYDDYYVFIDDASTTGTNSFIGLRLNGDTTDYAQFGNAITAEGTYTPSNLIGQYSNLTNSSFILAMPSSDNSVSAGSVQIRGANNTSLKMLIGIGGTGNGTFNGARQYTTMGYNDAGGAAITSISLFSSVGNFDAGTMYIYGSA